MESQLNALSREIRRRELEEAHLDDPLFAQYNVRTDLALEATEVVRSRTGQDIPGAQIEEEQTDYAKVTRMSIYSAQASRTLGKLPGHYCTIESPGLRDRDRVLQEEVSQTFAKEVSRFLTRIAPEALVMVVGLGNWNATPDALGPKVVNQLLVTRHLFELSPPELRQGLRPVSAIAPGVLGITGIETAEIVFALVKQVRPAMVIAIDALASRSTDRLCTTIQISDTGVHPGSGVGNRRIGLTPESLGIPVLAIGVPTVVHAVTLISDALEALGSAGAAAPAPASAEAQAPGAEGPGPFANIGQFLTGPPGDGTQPGENANQPEAQAAAHSSPGISRPPYRPEELAELLGPETGGLIITPRQIDLFIHDVAKVLAGGLNAALHPDIELSDVMRYLQ
ncbi:MAG TPA: GPR endopeptidase [Firmicutes bacterium]|nr:GPR endopeptidase [Bacillota bacterium]